MLAQTPQQKQLLFDLFQQGMQRIVLGGCHTVQHLVVQHFEGIFQQMEGPLKAPAQPAAQRHGKFLFVRLHGIPLFAQKRR